MTWTVDASNSGTTTALTIGSETTLATNTNNGTFVFTADLTNMAAGDIMELRLYKMALSGGTLRVAFKATYGPTLPTTVVVVSPPIPSLWSCRATAKQTAGTGRALIWELARI
jgi:hypothetical protein